MSFPETEDVPRCPLCGGGPAAVVLRGVDRLHGVPGEFGVVRCPDCALLWTSPRPTATSLPRYYPQDYEPFASTPPRRRRDRIADRWRLGLLQHRDGYRHLEADEPPALARLLWPRPPFRLPPFRGSGRLLEVGCGAGGFLAHARDFGWQVAGLDLSGTAVERARSLDLDVFHGTLEEFETQGRFDWIRLASVLEHVTDPVATLADAARLLTDEGRLHLVVPNAGGAARHWFGTYWFPLDLPRHLLHFTPRSLGAVASKAGLVIESLRHDSGPRGLQRSLAYRFPRTARWWRSRLTRRLLSPLATALDQARRGDSLDVVLRR